MGIQRRADQPVGIVNASGQPEIVLEIEGLKLSMAPGAKPAESAARAVPAPDDADPEVPR